MGGRFLLTGAALALMYLPFTPVMQPDLRRDPEEQVMNPVPGLLWSGLRMIVFTYGAVFAVAVVGVAIYEMVALTKHVKARAAWQRRQGKRGRRFGGWWIAPSTVGAGRASAPGLAAGLSF